MQANSLPLSGGTLQYSAVWGWREARRHSVGLLPAVHFYQQRAGGRREACTNARGGFGAVLQGTLWGQGLCIWLGETGEFSALHTHTQKATISPSMCIHGELAPSSTSHAPILENNTTEHTERQRSHSQLRSISKLRFPYNCAHRESLRALPAPPRAGTRLAAFILGASSTKNEIITKRSRR